MKTYFRNGLKWDRKLLLVLMALAVCSPVAMAQTFRGTILGTVTDSTGAALSGAKITVKNEGTGLTRETKTTDDGTYAVPELPIGSYTVRIEKEAFKIGEVTGVKVDVAGERRVDVSLQPGDVSQRVVVSGETLPMMDSTSNTLGGTLESATVLNLPINGRDYMKLIYMVPGIAGSPDQITDSPGSFGVFSMNGARGRANNFLLDGTDMNDGYRNDPAINEAGVFGTPATILPVEAVAELRVLSNFEAEYGRSAGGVVNIVTKSGTNKFHGSVLEYFRNSALDARNFFNTTDQPKNLFHNNQFGGALGGPIIPDRTFFFVDYEGLRERGGQTSLACVPTPQQLATATNPVIKALLLRKPWPTPNISNRPTDSSGCVNGNNLATSSRFSNRVDSMIAKIDHNLSKNNLLSGRYYFGDSDQSFPLALVGGGLLPGFNTATPTRVQLVSISWVHVISTNKVNEVRVGWNRFAEGFFPEDGTFNPSSIGLNTGVTAQDFGLPKISVGNFSTIGADAGDPRSRVDTNWHFIDNFSWKLTRHDVKFGYEFRRTSVSQILDRNFRGKLSFDSLDDFLVGMPTGGGSQARGNTNRNTAQNSHSLYVQDSIRLTQHITVNLGVRWDYFGLIHEKHGLFNNLDASSCTAANGFDPAKCLPFVGTPALPQFYNRDLNNFAPRVSLAWDPFGKAKTVVRLGYGIFYDAFSQDFFIGHLPFPPTFDPGPAYSGLGSAAISFGSAIPSQTLSSAQAVYSGFAPLGDAFVVDRNLHTPYMQNYNLNVEQQLSSHAVLQVSYVGSNGRHLFRFRDINQPNQAAINAYDPSLGCCVPRPIPTLFYILQQETSANSNYNSLQASLRLRSFKGFDSTLNYVWSHSIDTASDGEDFVPNASQPNNSLRPDLEKGNSNFDIRQRLTWNFIYELPKWKGRWSRLTDGWGINGVLTLQAGQPFHLNYNFQGDYDGSGSLIARPDVVGPIKYNRNDPTQFLDLTSFAAPCRLVGGTADSNCAMGSWHFGSLGRNSLRGPDFRQFDFSVFKNTAVNERVNVQFRVEVYNLVNHPNFANPYLPIFIADAAPNGISDGSAGQPAIGRSLGFLPLTATGDVGIGYPFLGGGGPRAIQFAVKLSF